MPTSGTPVTSVQVIVSSAATVGPRACAGARPASARATSGRVSLDEQVQDRAARRAAKAGDDARRGGKRGRPGRVTAVKTITDTDPDLHRMLRDLGGVAQGQVLLGGVAGRSASSHSTSRSSPSAVPAAPDWKRDRYEDDEDGHVEDRKTNGVIRIGRARARALEDQDEQPAQPVRDDRIPQQAAPRQARQRAPGTRSGQGPARTPSDEAPLSLSGRPETLSIDVR